ncbi:ester cyclase [Pseudolysinimonas sp.]|uniref:ester cyclase n=1 Tax=Pseudolysinimonas sp. TaxID=2680009 RepID=UPI003F7FAD19
MTPDELRAWHADYLDACNRHDLVAIRGFVAPAVRRAHLPGGGDAWVADLDELFRAFPDFRWKRVALLVEGDRIAVHLRAGGTHRASGRHVNVAEFGILRVADGRITEYAGAPGATDLIASVA